MIVKLASQTLANGDVAYVCHHMAQWLPLATQCAINEGFIVKEFDIMQAKGDYEKSGVTHLDGTAIDIAQTDIKLAYRMRCWGAPATWPRGKGYGQDMQPHIHSVLDCPCNSRADYQITQVKNGYAGLASNTPDYVNKPDVWRNFESGMKYMHSLIEREKLMARIASQLTLEFDPDSSHPAEFTDSEWRVYEIVRKATLQAIKDAVAGDTPDRARIIPQAVARVRTVKL